MGDFTSSLLQDKTNHRYQHSSLPSTKISVCENCADIAAVTFCFQMLGKIILGNATGQITEVKKSNSLHFGFKGDSCFLLYMPSGPIL